MELVVEEGIRSQGSWIIVAQRGGKPGIAGEVSAVEIDHSLTRGFVSERSASEDVVHLGHRITGCVSCTVQILLSWRQLRQQVLPELRGRAEVGGSRRCARKTHLAYGFGGGEIVHVCLLVDDVKWHRHILLRKQSPGQSANV